LISGFVLMGVGLRRLKIASDTNGKEYSYGHGVNAIMLSAVITSGAAIGQQLYFQKAWYWSVPAPLFLGRQSVFLIALDTIHESIHIAGLMARSLA
jgi:hypothetical protein